MSVGIQEGLFEITATTSASVQESPRPLIPLQIEGDFPSVPLDVHTGQLLYALKELGLASRNAGMATANENPQHAAEFQTRYGSRTNDVVEATEYVGSTHDTEARDAFRRAFNGWVLLTETDPTTWQVWADFRDRYAGSRGRVARDGYKKQLTKTRKSLGISGRDGD